jgi:hypothetical protein
MCVRAGGGAARSSRDDDPFTPYTAHSSAGKARARRATASRKWARGAKPAGCGVGGRCDVMDNGVVSVSGWCDQQMAL